MKLAAAIMVSLLLAQIRVPNEAISACDALKRRTALAGKLVTIRGLQIATEEGAWLKAMDCGENVVAGGRSWPGLIWLEMSVPSRKAAGFREELELSVKRINAETAKLGFNPKRDRLWLTYIGLFEAENNSGQHLDSSAGRGTVGFGHLNAAPARLIVKDVRDPIIERGQQ